MHCCLIAWDYPPSPSGLSTAAREIAESLAEAGCRMTVVTLDRTGDDTANGVHIVGAGIAGQSRLGRLRLWGGVGHLAAPIALRRTVHRLHRQQPFDIVEATNWYAPAALLGANRALPLVTRMSTPAAYSRVPAGTMRDRLDGAAADRLELRQVWGSAGLISNAAGHGQRMAGHYGIGPDRPHAVIGLSLPPDFLAEARAAPFDNGGPARLLFVGRAEERKGFAEILAAVATLGAEADMGRLPEFALRLLGVADSDLPASLPAPARRRITALGRRPQAELMNEYRRAQVVLAPSRYESFGLVYQEGLAFGRVVLASATDDSARDFVAEGGVLARETSAEAIAEALRPLIAQPGQRLARRAAALAAAGRFSRRTLAQDTIALYRRALVQGRSEL